MKWRLTAGFVLVAATIMATSALAGSFVPECAGNPGPNPTCQGQQILIHNPDAWFLPCADDIGRGRGCVNAPISDFIGHPKPSPRCPIFEDEGWSC